jgi:hypothetical protein
MTEQEQAQDLIHWLKDDIKCLYMVSEIKNELKDISEEKYQYWDRVHKIIYNHFINK